MDQKNTKFAIYMTILWIVGIFTLYFIGLFERPTSFSELGDFLAGIFAPIAFFWLIYGYMQQEMHHRTQKQQMLMSVRPRITIIQHISLQLPQSNIEGVTVGTLKIRLKNIGNGRACSINIHSKEYISKYEFVTRRAKIEVDETAEVSFSFVVDDIKFLDGTEYAEIDFALEYQCIYGQSYEKNFKVRVSELTDLRSGEKYLNAYIL